MDLGRVAVVGSGSWATALAKVIVEHTHRIGWYVRRQYTIDRFKSLRHNPGYLRNLSFDTSEIDFSSDLNYILSHYDTLLFVTPSPYVKELLDKVRVPLSGKFIITAIKGVVPGENTVFTEYIHSRFGVPESQLACIGGPSHAEEVAQQRLTFLTVGCVSPERADAFCRLLRSPYVKTKTSRDVVGIEYAAVLKNVYAICAGICRSLGYGDNFQAVLMSNAMQEMNSLLSALNPISRDMLDTLYLGDLLVTGYSRLSRNFTFGSMIGRGYGVKAVQAEMEMIAEGYFGTKCMYAIAQELRTHHVHLSTPILDTVHRVLYERGDVGDCIRLMAHQAFG